MAKYSPYKMKGHTLPGIKQRQSDDKGEKTYTINGKEVSEKEYNKRSQKIGPRDESGGFTTIENEGAPVKGPQITTTTYSSDYSNKYPDYSKTFPRKTKKGKKSPAKCPLIAALAPAVIGAISKKKEQ